jgi:hypothetical protein
MDGRHGGRLQHGPAEDRHLEFLMRRFLAGLGAALLVAGSVAGTHLYEAHRVPPAIHRACGLVMDAYEQVAARADADQDVRNAEGHDPVDYWTAAQQAKLV